MASDAENNTAIVFPGVSEIVYADVAQFMLTNRYARLRVAEASAVLGYHLTDAYRDATRPFSEAARVAFLANCLALADWAAAELGLSAAHCVGPSFGGIAAAVHAGALTFPDAVRLTCRWGRCLDEYFATEHSDTVSHSFARLPAATLDEILQPLAKAGEWHDIACYVDADFHIVSVREYALAPLIEAVQAAGGLPLQAMRPPMHSPYFAALRDRVEREVLDGLPVADPVLSLIDDHDARPVRTAAGVRDMILDGITRPVHWPEVVAALRERGVTRLWVSGPDSLWGRVRCATEAFDVVPVRPQSAMRPRKVRRPVGV